MYYLINMTTSGPCGKRLLESQILKLDNRTNRDPWKAGYGDIH
jgi:hypothetical protein